MGDPLEHRICQAQDLNQKAISRCTQREWLIITANSAFGKVMKINFLFIFLVMLCFPSLGWAGNPSIHVCFTPGQDCTGEIIKILNGAKLTIYVQAYSFTSAPIAEALLNAKKRGVNVKVILDKSQYKSEKYSSAKFLKNHDIPVWIDAKPAIAHNKIMIIDDQLVITGSFNFTKAAQEKNAENLLIIEDQFLAKQYLNNWRWRQSESIIYNNYQPHTKT